MIEQDVSTISFAAFSVDGVLGGQTIQVIVDTGVETLDENTGETRFYSHLVTMLKSDAIFNKGDTLISNSKSYELQDIITDDGYIVVISAL